MKMQQFEITLPASTSIHDVALYLQSVAMGHMTTADHAKELLHALWIALDRSGYAIMYERQEALKRFEAGRV